MIKLRQIKINVENDSIDKLKHLVSMKLNVAIKDILSLQILKRSIDARKKPLIFYIYELGVEVSNEVEVLSLLNDKDILKYEEKSYSNNITGVLPVINPTIIGAGPCGLMCAYLLAKEGYKPIIYDRGKKIEDRVLDVDNFFSTGVLDINSNVQFGEGGAGTFSDGKLNTLIKDKEQRGKYFLKLLVEHGAPKEILYDSKPHIGTDLLREVIINLRNSIIELGATFKYSFLLTDINFVDQTLDSFTINDNEVIKSNCLVLAIGHSARDTFNLLHVKEVDMTSKPFAVGLRIMHSQSMINESQIGVKSHEKLLNQSYKLVYNSKENRGVYTFCMCPGGYVINSSSEEGKLVVNGMSNYQRESGIANSAIIVTVDNKDYGNNVLSGVEFQKRLESDFYNLGKGKIPVQRYIDFKNDVKTLELGTVKPMIKGDYIFENIRSVLPDYITSSLIDAIEYFGTKIKGFNIEDALLAGVESRTSAPLRVIRDDNLESNMKGVYPAGEGSGYAGGIVSSAIDGMKVAEQILKKYNLSVK